MLANLDLTELLVIAAVVVLAVMSFKNKNGEKGKTTGFIGIAVAGILALSAFSSGGTFGAGGFFGNFDTTEVLIMVAIAAMVFWPAISGEGFGAINWTSPQTLIGLGAIGVMLYQSSLSTSTFS